MSGEGTNRLLRSCSTSPGLNPHCLWPRIPFQPILRLSIADSTRPVQDKCKKTNFFTFFPVWGKEHGIAGMSCRLRNMHMSSHYHAANMHSHVKPQECDYEAELFVGLYYKGKMLPPLKSGAKLLLALTQPTFHPLDCQLLSSQAWVQRV